MHTVGRVRTVLKNMPSRPNMSDPKIQSLEPVRYTSDSTSSTVTLQGRTYSDTVFTDLVPISLEFSCNIELFRARTPSYQHELLAQHL